MGDVLKLQRHSVENILADITELGPQARGVIAVVFTKEGGGHYRISGFLSRSDSFTLCGLLDWVKADLMADILNAASPL